jgi:ParB-like chromosome segregation protein Spo0J
MQIQSFSVKELLQTTAEYNPRKDLKKGDAEYEKLKKSILEFGYVDPIVYNEATGRLVGGHQRLKILHELGYEEVDVSVVNMDEIKEKALNLTLNKSGGAWDNEKLADLLEELTFELADLEITGFNAAELDDLVREMDFQNTMNGSFLDDIIHADTDQDTEEYEDSSITESEYEDAEEKEEMFTLKYPVSFEDRDIVMEAVALCKRNNLAETSPQAIVEICKTFLKLNRQL